jgi:exodeoxyribonuclease VII small subunit
MSQNSNELSFEKAYEKLELILEKMNHQALSLEESIALFEEADQLISHCGTKIEQAEKKIETIIKNRTDGSIKLADFDFSKQTS